MDNKFIKYYLIAAGIITVAGFIGMAYESHSKQVCKVECIAKNIAAADCVNLCK